MSITFNADEIFKIGVQIEKNGYTFYTGAAAQSEDENIKKLLSELAYWEECHIKIFEDLRKSFAAYNDAMAEYDPDNMVHLYLKSVADSRVFVRGQKMDGVLESCKTLVDVLTNALEFEKDSVVFYSSMKEIVRDDLGKKEIDKLIREELMHVGIITKELGKLTGV